MTTHYVYLGGSHLENTLWMNRFAAYAANMTSSITIKGINPFNRTIDESDNKAIVQRDLKILQDSLLTHVVLKSNAPGGLLTTGTSFECILSVFLKKPVIVISTPASDKVIADNAVPRWFHPFVEYFADAIVEDIQDAIEWIYADIQNPRKRIGLSEKLDQIDREFQFNALDPCPFH